MTALKRVVILAVCCTAWASGAAAQSHFGLRTGVSGDPGQFVFGGHVETRPLLTHLTFRPNVELGVGNGGSLVAFNLEFAYWFDPGQRPWRVYVGAGPAAVIRHFDSSNATGPGNTDVGGGFNFLVGMQHAGGLFVELKVGAIDSPAVRFTVGYAFR
jgi:hypothetical protein